MAEPVKHQIGRVCANPRGRDRGQNKNQEFVEIFSGTSKLSSHRLQHIVNPKSQNPKWDDMFEFPITAVFGTGTHIIVHNGSGIDGYDSQGNYSYYSAGAGKRGNWKLNNDGDIVRLLDPQGNEICRRVLRGDECENAVRPPVIVPPVSAPRAYGEVED